MKSTYFPRGSQAERRWHLVDADGVVLGRLASRVAGLLRGKGKATFSPYRDEGDFVVVVNAGKVRLTGRKLDQKTAFRHSMWPGGLKLVPYKRLMAEKPEFAIRRAVNGMLCKNKLRDRMLTRLKIYRGATHPHGPQMPRALALASA